MTILAHENEVAARFDQLESRFKDAATEDDVRLRALREALGPVRGQRILDLGCGKGRFARPLTRQGAEVFGIDLSAAMLAAASDLPRARASARRLPFPSAAFDAVIAIEVFEHVAALDEVVREARRVLRPGGILAVIDKNAAALDARRPWLPSLAVKWLDEKRGLWMYPSGGPVRERWFWPGRFRRSLLREFDEVRLSFLLAPREADHWLFRSVPRARLLTLWTARVAGRCS